MTEWLEIEPAEGQDEGTTVFIQMPKVQTQDEDEPFRVSRSGKSETKKTSLDKVRDAVQGTIPLFRTIRESFTNMNNPKSIEMEFSLGLTLDSSNSVAAFVVGKASAEAAFSVKVAWENPEKIG